MYSLGVVFFELWHPFGTAMERHITLLDLKQKGNLPPLWVADFPEQATLLRRLMSPSPSERPSATELLEHAFPPRMEYELLDSMYSNMSFLCVHVAHVTTCKYVLSLCVCIQICPFFVCMWHTLLLACCRCPVHDHACMHAHLLA